MSEFCGIVLNVELRPFEDLSIAGKTLTRDEEFIDEQRFVTTLNVGRPFNKLSNGSDFSWVIDENINVKHDNKTTIQLASIHRLSDKSELINKLNILLENGDFHDDQSDHVLAVVIYRGVLAVNIERFYIEGIGADKRIASLSETLNKNERCRVFEDDLDPLEEKWMWMKK